MLAACVSSIGAYYHHYSSPDSADGLYNQLKWMYNNSTNTNYPTGIPLWIGRAFNYYGLSYYYTESGMNYLSTAAILATGNPIYASLSNADQTSAHGVVICGYTSAPGSGYYYKLMDPNINYLVWAGVSSNPNVYTFSYGGYNYWRRYFYSAYY